MNVNDQWMLEKMQQMAANMAASLPQAGQNTDTPEAGKGESFKDMLDKAKDQKVEAPKKDNTVKKTDAIQKKEPVQKTESKVVTDMKDPRIKAMDPVTQAQIAAGFLTPVETKSGDLLLRIDTMPSAVIIPMLPNGQIDWSKPFVLSNSDGEQFEVYLDPVNGEHQLFQLTDEGRKQIDLFPEQPKLDLLNNPKALDMTVVTREGKVTTLREAMEEFDDQDDTNLDASAMADKPLFKDVKATPVKVGENFQLDTENSDMEENLADTIRYAAQQGLRQIEIKLSPENLGSLTVKLTQAADGTLQVVLHAANPKAANLLSQHLDGLNAALQGYGQNNEVRVEVQRNEDSQQAQQQQQQQTDPNGHNRQSQQQQQRQEEQHSGDFLQRLRLGLFEDM